MRGKQAKKLRKAIAYLLPNVPDKVYQRVVHRKDLVNTITDEQIITSVQIVLGECKRRAYQNIKQLYKRNAGRRSVWSTAQ